MPWEMSAMSTTWLTSCTMREVKEVATMKYTMRKRSVRGLRLFGRLVGRRVVNVLDRAAKHAMDRGDYGTAAALYRRGLIILKGARGSGIDRTRAQSLSSLATLARLQGRYRTAERLFRRALSEAREAFGPNDLGLARLLNDFAVLCKYQGRFAEATLLYRRALTIMEITRGPDHPEIATIYHNLGGLEHARGRYVTGEPFARRAVEIRERA